MTPLGYLYSVLIGFVFGSIIGYQCGACVNFKRMFFPLAKKLVGTLEEITQGITKVDRKLDSLEVKVVQPQEWMDPRRPEEADHAIQPEAQVVERIALPESLVQQYDQSGTMVNCYERR